jgi:Zn-dependent protease with chaperone function
MSKSDCKKWFIYSNDEVSETAYTKTELEEINGFDSETLVQRDSSTEDEWIPAQDDPDLVSIFRPDSPSQVNPPNSEETEENTQETQAEDPTEATSKNREQAREDGSLNEENSGGKQAKYNLKNIKNIRYESEALALMASAILLIVMLLAFIPVTFGVIIAVVIFGLVAVKIRQESIIGQSILVTKDNYPNIHQWADDIAESLDMARPRIHIRQDPYLNAFSLGFIKPYTVVLHSAVAEELSENEIKFILGHEFGHIKFNHTTLLTIINPLTRYLFGFRKIFTFVFGFWSRRGEYTADRTGLLACEDQGAANSALIKIAGGLDGAERIKTQDFPHQSTKANTGSLYKLSELFQDHPFPPNRVKQLDGFEESLTHRG